MLAIVFLLTMPLWAAPPEEVVRQLYQTHLETDRLDQTVQRASRCFTPGFLGVIERALARKPGPSGYVDVDFLTHSQGGWGDFEVGQTFVTGKNAVVMLKVWSGLRSHGPDGPLPPEERKAMRKRITPQQVKIYLTDVGDGDGFQIKDIEFPAHQEGNEKIPAFQVRAWLKGIADGR